MFRRTAFVLAVFMCLGLFTISAQAQTICNNQVGTQGQWTYEYWKDNGTGCMTLGSGGSFSCEWSNIGNLLARKGLRPGSSSLVVTYGANYQPNGNSYLCIYGWTTGPLVEYYIVESWGSWRPPGGEGYKSSVTIDGGSYDIYQTMRYNQPSIEGTATFPQFWSVRTSKRSSGTIHVGQHFNAWAQNGMQMGGLYEVSFCVEGYQSSGTADVYSMSMGTGDDDDDDDDDDNSNPISAFSTIQAENYSSTTSSTLEQIGTGSGNGIGYIESGDTVTYRNVDFGSGVSSFSANVASEQNSNIQIRIGSASGTLLGTLSNVSTGSWDSYQNKSVNLSGSVTGVQNLVLVFSGPVNVDSFVFTRGSGDDDDDDDDDNSGNMTVPGKIEAENFTGMSGVEVESCGEGGQNVGYIDQGDWIEYRVNVLQSGNYTVNYRLASQSSSGAFNCLVNGSTQHNVSVPNTGDWQSYQTVSRSMYLSSGSQTIRLTATGSYWNINWMELQLVGGDDDDDDDDDDDNNSTSAFSTIQAEYYDSTTSSTLEQISTGSGSGIGYIESGDTVTYRNIDFGSGAASFRARVASQVDSNIQVRIGSASGTLLGTLSNVSTGSWDTYQDKSTSISSVTGVQDVVLVFSGPVNVDSFTFSTSSGDDDDDDDDDDYTGGKLIALTFDDGPNNSITPQVLDKLAQHGVVASFFLIGQNVNSGVQAVMQRQLSLGCEINNHSWSHSDMTGMSSWEIQQEITNTNNAIYQQVGVTPKFFRPPYISYNNTMFQAIDLPFINGINCNDWDSSVSASQRAQTIISNARDGDIVLLHDYDGNYNTVQALDAMIQGLKNNGFSFVTVSRLFELKGVNPNQEYKIWTNPSY